MACAPYADFLGRHRNEDTHTGHVAGLALRVFERCREPWGLSDEDERWLRAASLLHDVGYGSRPDDHVPAGVELILSSDLPGMSDEARRAVAGIAGLHSGDWAARAEEPLIRDHHARSRLLLLGAILRVADGLDHGHIQNTTIRLARFQEGVLRLFIDSPGYSGNLPWAVRKAEMWNRVAPCRIDIVADPVPPGRPTYYGVLRKEDTMLQGAKRLLHLQYRIVADNRDGAAAGEDPERLHDLRVAIRRSRAAVRFFRRLAVLAPALSLSDGWGAVNRQLGGTRDQDVWLEYLSSATVRDACGKSAEWAGYLDLQVAGREQAPKAARGILEGREFADLMRRWQYFLRVELSDALRGDESPPLKAHATRRLRKALPAILDHPRLSAGTLPEEAHDLRRVCRRTRYWAEFLTPVLGRSTATLARRLKAVADTLGELHDIDTGLARVVEDSRPVPAGLLTALNRDRRRWWRAYDASWEKLTRRKFRRKILNDLTAAEEK